MPGMKGSSSGPNPALVRAFRSAVLHDWLIILLVVALIAAVWNVLRIVELRRQARSGTLAIHGTATRAPEPPGRRLLRISFGVLWLLDGLLQSQAAIPAELANHVIRPTANASPSWVADIVHAFITLWNSHPIPAASSALWVQIGIGVWLLSSDRGPWSRAGGWASAAWGAGVWIFGESFGGLLAPGTSWLFGAPGAAAFYVAAGILLALPDRHFATPRLGLTMLRILGVLMLMMAMLQAWPGRGFWHGHGVLSDMVVAMASTPQPHVVATWVAWFARLSTAHGFAVNLAAVIALAAGGGALASTRMRAGRLRTAAGALPLFPFAVATTIVSLATWVLIQDGGVFGGLGTDPNSMIPMVAVLWSGYAAATRIHPALPAEPTAAWVPRLSLRALADFVGRSPAQSMRAFAAAAALFITAFGLVPVAVAAATPAPHHGNAARAATTAVRPAR